MKFLLEFASKKRSMTAWYNSFLLLSNIFARFYAVSVDLALWKTASCLPGHDLSNPRFWPKSGMRK
ncbi:MAG: hypothetical protein DMG67_05370 [Acidobacteria bacterium]|nr:MAG: hypothetical protein DMG67_05370 [Acidobacteriota bacterium]